ncbi:hypothetical protein ACYSNW_10715 [Enterococcus sp. LJL99]
MKKISFVTLFSLAILGGLSAATPAFANDGTDTDSQQTISGADTADIEVNGTLGADNTDPGATIPEGSDDWINVTVPTKTIFYNTVGSTTIKAPTYTITNNSGRPVAITTEAFAARAGNPATLPNDFALNLSVGGSTTVPLIEAGAVSSVTGSSVANLANSKGQTASTDPEVTDPTTNSTTFTYTGTATATEQLKVNYDLTLKFDAISWN